MRGGGRTGPWRRTVVPALAVYDHARAQDQGAAVADLMEGPEAGRRSAIIVGNVATDVAEIDAQPDPGRLVTHGICPADGGEPAVRIAHVPDHITSGRVQVVRTPRVHVPSHRVEHGHLGAVAHELVDDV